MCLRVSIETEVPVRRGEKKVCHKEEKERERIFQIENG